MQLLKAEIQMKLRTISHRLHKRVNLHLPEALIAASLLASWHQQAAIPWSTRNEVAAAFRLAVSATVLIAVTTIVSCILLPQEVFTEAVVWLRLLLGRLDTLLEIL